MLSLAEHLRRWTGADSHEVRTMPADKSRLPCGGTFAGGQEPIVMKLRDPSWRTRADSHEKPSPAY